jgi:cation diffusion facilitator family transporter
MTVLAAQQSTTTGSYEHVIWISFWGNLGLAILKIGTGILGYSTLLFADGLHSSANATISIVLLIGVIAGARPKDIKHPYGHHKAQYILSCTAGLIILIAACYLFMLGIRSMRWIDTTGPNIIVLLVVIVSIFGNELLFRYGTYASREFDSGLLQSNAWNNRLNTFSSVVVLTSLLGAMVGFWRLEQLAIMIVAVIIIWTCMRIFQSAFEGLMSKALPAEMTDKIKRIVESVKEVKAISTIKTQLAGEKIHLDLVVVMDGTITTANAKIIVNKIRKKLLQEVKKVEQVRIGFESV